jgi:putative membrane protein
MKIINSIAVFASVIMFAVFSTSALSQRSSKLSDAEVASIAVTANQSDIKYAEIAKEKSKDADILNFAETMISAHELIKTQTAALIKKLGVTPEDNAITQKLLTLAEKRMKMLRLESGKSFDVEYIDTEVAYHKTVIAIVEDLLIPETDNEELKDLLENVVQALEIHLNHAIMVQTKISK